MRGLAADHYAPEEIASWSEPPDRTRYEASLNDGEVCVAETGGTPCGYGRFSPAEREVQAVYVHPDHAGKGIGRMILQYLEDRARDGGVHDLSLRSSLNAEAFYLRLGWRSVERTTHLTRGGVEVDCVWMEKSLSP